MYNNENLLKVSMKTNIIHAAYIQFSFRQKSAKKYTHRRKGLLIQEKCSFPNTVLNNAKQNCPKYAEIMKAYENKISNG